MRELGTVNWVKSLNTRILGITSKRKKEKKKKINSGYSNII